MNGTFAVRFEPDLGGWNIAGSCGGTNSRDRDQAARYENPALDILLLTPGMLNAGLSILQEFSSTSMHTAEAQR